MAAGMDQTFMAAFTAVITVLCTAGIGVYAAWRGVLPKVGLKHLDKLVSEILTPCMVFYKVVPNASWDNLSAIGPMVLMALLTVVFGLVSGWLACRLLSPAYPEAFPRFQGLVMVACGFPNTFAIPLTLQLTLVDQPVFLSDKTPTVDAVRDRSLALFLFSYTVWILLRWSIGFPILTGAMTDFKTWVDKMLNPPTVACLIALVLGLLNGTLGEDVPRDWLGPVVVALEYGAKALVPVIQFSLGAKMYAVVQDFKQDEEAGSETKVELATTSGGDTTDGQQLMAVELTEEGAAGMVPAPNKGQLPADGSAPTPQGGPTLPFISYVVIVAVRQVCGALIGAGVGYGLYNGGWVTDKIALMISMLQAAGPPMINMSVMASLSGDCEKEAVQVILWTYAASILTWTGSIALFLTVLEG